MKTAIVVYQDAADEPLEALDGRTLLQAARARTATRLAQQGRGGWIPSEMTADAAARPLLLAQVCGMSRDQVRTLRRGPLEAWLLDSPPAPGDWVYHVDLIAEDAGVIRSMPRLADQETRELAAALNAAAGSDRGRFAAAAGTLVLILREVGEDLPEGVPTEQAVDQTWREVMAGGRDRGRLCALMDQARDTLASHPVNEIRIDLGEDPANGIWLCGGGRWPNAAARPEAVRPATLLSESLLGRGLARMLKLHLLPLQRPAPGADGPWLHVPDLVEAIRSCDTLVVDVAVRRTDHPVDGVRELDRIDQHLLLPLTEILAAHRPARIALVAGSVISPETGLPVAPRLPVVIVGDELPPDAVLRWEESACTAGSLGQIDLDLLPAILAAPLDASPAPFALGTAEKTLPNP